MSDYISISDFAGLTKVAGDKYTDSDLQSYLDQYEVIFLQELLGADLYAEFATDWGGSAPSSAKFTAIWNSFAIDYDCEMVKSEGILNMLKYLIYFEYLRDQPIKNNIAGNMINQQANSQEALPSETNMYTNYNKGIETYKAIQWYIDCYNVNNYDYSEYNGQYKDYTTFI